MTKKITIRWLDGMVEVLEFVYLRFSPSFIWVAQDDGTNRWIPTSNIRVFSINPDSKM